MNGADAYRAALGAAVKDRWSEVRGLLEERVATTPDDSAARVLLARVLVRQGLAFKALSILEGAGTLFDSADRATTLGAELAILLLRLGRTVDAEEALGRTLAVAPEAVRARAALGHLYQHRGEIGLAAAEFSRVGNPRVVREVEREIGASRAAGDQEQRDGTAATTEWVIRGASAEAGPGSSAGPATTIRQSLVESLLSVDEPRSDSVFTVAGAWVTIRCHERVYSRLGSVLFADAHVAWSPESARGPSADADRPLGAAGATLGAIFRVDGDGQLAVALREGDFATRLALAAESLYVREDSLFGFSSGIDWENGTFQAGDEGDAIPLVFLEGSGELLLVTRGPTARLAVMRGHSVVVSADRLVAWVGRIVPSAVRLTGTRDTLATAIHLAGDGTVLVRTGAE